MSGLLRALAVELIEDMHHPVPIGANLRQDKDWNQRVRWWRIAPTPSTAPLTLLDGTANSDLLFVTFDSLNVVDAPAQRNAEFEQIVGKTFSDTSITGRKDPAERERVRTGLMASIRREAGAADGSVFLAATKNALTELGFTATAGGWTPPQELAELDIRAAHFGSLLGRNDFSDCVTGVVIGRPLLPARAIEDDARAFAAAAGMPLETVAGRLPTEMRTITDRDGGSVEIPVSYHPNMFANAVLEQRTDAEITQAIDRIRCVRNLQAKRIVVLGHHVIQTPDRVQSWGHYRQGGSSLEQMLDGIGIIVESLAEAFRVFPEIFESQSGANRVLHGLESDALARLVSPRISLTYRTTTAGSRNQIAHVRATSFDEARRVVEATAGALVLCEPYETNADRGADAQIGYQIAKDEARYSAWRRLNEAWGKNGFVPLSGSAAAKMLPTIFANERTARKDIEILGQEMLNRPSDSYIEYNRELTDDSAFSHFAKNVIEVEFKSIKSDTWKKPGSTQAYVDANSTEETTQRLTSIPSLVHGITDITVIATHTENLGRVTTSGVRQKIAGAFDIAESDIDDDTALSCTSAVDALVAITGQIEAASGKNLEYKEAVRDAVRRLPSAA